MSSTDGPLEPYDPTHPIARLDTIDVVTELAGGGAYYGLVVPDPLEGDVCSQERLIKKIENYIGDFLSPESIACNGMPSPNECRIYVFIHPDSAPAIFAILNQCRAWAADNGIGFEVVTDLDQHLPPNNSLDGARGG